MSTAEPDIGMFIILKYAVKKYWERAGLCSVALARWTAGTLDGVDNNASSGDPGFLKPNNAWARFSLAWRTPMLSTAWRLIRAGDKAPKVGEIGGTVKAGVGAGAGAGVGAGVGA